MGDGLTVRFMKNKVVVAILLFFAVLIPYANTFDNEFLWDDITLIVHNEHLHDASKNINFIRDFWWVDELNKGSPYFRPIISIQYIIDYNLWELNPWGYHLTNILVMAKLCFVLYLLISRLYGPGVAFFSSVIFAVHPIHTENVAWIAGRTDVTMGLFYVLSLLFYVRYRDLHLNSQLYLSLVCGLLALLSKEVAVTLPFAIVLYEYCFRSSAKKKWKVLLSYFGLMPLFFVLRTLAFEGEGNFIFLDGLVLNAGLSELFNSVLKVLYSFSNYLYLTFFPAVLKIRWEIAPFYSILEGRVFFAIAIFALFCWYTWRLYHEDKKKLFLPLFFLLNIVLVVNIITVRDAFAERFVFLASIAVCVFIPLLLKELFTHKRYVFTILCMVILVFGVRTHIRNNDWQDQVSLVSKEIEVNPNSAEANFLYGSVLQFELNQTNEAIGHFIRATQLDDTRTDAHLVLGIMAKENKQLEPALYHFSKCKEYGPPEYIWKASLNEGMMLYDYGFELLGLGENATARIAFNDAANNFLYLADRKPYVAEFHVMLADAWFLAGKYDSAALAIAEAKKRKEFTSVESNLETAILTRLQDMSS